MTTAAVYARKSTQQDGPDDKSESVTRQLAHARAFAAERGWTVLDQHVYYDDAISGAEFVDRPGFVRMMAAITEGRRPPFDVLVMSDQDRLGRDMLRTATAVRDITEAGVRVFTYLDKTEITAESLMDQVRVVFAGFGGQFERERISARVRDALRRKVTQKAVGGGKCYGYVNVPVLGPSGERTHSVRQIDEAQAVTVRRIFQMVADGVGMKRIARQLMAEGVAPPARRNSRGWEPATVGVMVRNVLYRGQVVWGQWETVRRRGKKIQRRRDPAQVITMDAPELRVIDEGLWRAANAALSRKAEAYQRGPRGRLQGRPEGTLASAFLLTGLSSCAACGGSMFVHRRSQKPAAERFYACARHERMGPVVCANGLIIPMADADHLVVEAFAQDILQPRHVEKFLADTLDAWRSATERPEQRRKALEEELRQVEAQIAKLESDLASGAPWTLIRGPIEERNGRRDDLRARLAAEAGMVRLGEASTAVRADLAARLTDWQGLLRRQPIHSRQILKKLLEGKIAFSPFDDERGRGYEIRGRAVYGRLLAGVLPIGARSVSTPPGRWYPPGVAPA